MSGLVLSFVLGCAVYAIIQSLGFRGRGTIAIAVLCGSAFWALWSEAVRSPFSAVLGTTLVVFIAGTGGVLFVSSLNQKPAQPPPLKVEGTPATVQVANRSAECTVVLVDGKHAAPDVDRGQTFSEHIFNDPQNICIVSSSLAVKLFIFEDPINRRILLSDPEDMFEILGTTDRATEPADVIWLIDPAVIEPVSDESE